MKMNRQKSREKRSSRMRASVLGTAIKPRLSVFRSAKHIYAQVIDDFNGVTLAAASSAGKNTMKDSGNVKGAEKIGEMIAERAKTKNISTVVFDRNGFKYHGRIKALAEAARGKGLKF